MLCALPRENPRIIEGQAGRGAGRSPFRACRSLFKRTVFYTNEKEKGMPGFDGTGPRGTGPMTGAARGYCLLRVPEDIREPAGGFAGIQGRPVRIDPFAGSRLELLQMQAAWIEDVLCTIRHRMDWLKKAVHAASLGRGKAESERLRHPGAVPG